MTAVPAALSRSLHDYLSSIDELIEEERHAIGQLMVRRSRRRTFRNLRPCSGDDVVAIRFYELIEHGDALSVTTGVLTRSVLLRLSARKEASL